MNEDAFFIQSSLGTARRVFGGHGLDSLELPLYEQVWKLDRAFLQGWGDE